MSFEYKREPLEDNEIEDLKKNCESFEEQFIINVLLETGMRVSELTHLEKENVSWQRGCIVTIGKGNKRRVIPMSKTTRFYLTEFFKGDYRTRYSARWIQKIVHKVAEKAGIMKNVTPHVLRHTFAVCYLHRGGNLRALQGILGHTHIQTTDQYLNYSGERVIEDFNKVWEN